MPRTKFNKKPLPEHLRKCPHTYHKVDTDLNLTPRERIFVQEYLYDWNSRRAAKAAGYNPRTAGAIGHELQKKPKIKKYIKQVQDNVERHLGLSKMRVIHEHMKIAFSSIAHLHDTWTTRKEFEELTDDQKSCIAEIQTQTRRVESENGVMTYVDFVKIKLYDKQRALDSISKMLGYDSPTQIHIKSEAEIKHVYRGLHNYLNDLTPEELSAMEKLGIPQLTLDASGN